MGKKSKEIAGAGVDGPGTLQRRHRPPTVGQREHHRETRAPHPHQTKPRRDRR